MQMIRQIEDTLAGIFKDLPALPKGGKEGLVTIFPWIALIFGIVQLAGAWGLYQLTNLTINTFGLYAAITPMQKATIYLSIVVLLIDAVILLMAFSPLQKKIRRGWDLLFIAGLVNLAYGVLSIFMYSGGFGNFMIGVITSAIMLYLLFQVREYYTGNKKQTKKKTKKV